MSQQSKYDDMLSSEDDEVDKDSFEYMFKLTQRLKTRLMAKPYIRAPLPILWSYKSRYLRQLNKNTHTQQQKKA